MSECLLLSGGIDSTALCYWRRPELALTIDYGQVPAAGEVQAAQQICRVLGVRHEVLRIDCSAIGSGDLAGDNPASVAPVPEWWPYRNQLLGTLAAGVAIREGLGEVVFASVRSDGVHADGTPNFYRLFDGLVKMQEGQVSVIAPAIALSSVELVQRSGVPRDILGWTFSCHTGELACGECRGCFKHFHVMQELYGDGADG